MKSFDWRNYLPYGLSLLALVGFIVYLCHNVERYGQLLKYSTELIISLLGLILLFNFVNGWINFIFYNVLQVPLGFHEAIGLSIVNTLANQLPFAGGLVVKGFYLKQRYELSYSRFLSTILALYIFFLASNGMLGLATLFLLSKVGVSNLINTLFIAFGLMSSSVLLIKLPIKKINNYGRFGSKLIRILDGWQILSKDQRSLLYLLFLQTSSTLIFAARFWIVFNALSQDVTYLQCVLFSAATILTRLVSIAPGGLVVREAIVASIGALFGIDLGVSVVAVALDRIIATTVIFILGTIYSYILGKDIASKKIS